MKIINYWKSNHQAIISDCVKALNQGKAVVYPTDTSYGLAVDAESIKAVKKLYKIKGRQFNKPVHVVVPSVSYAKSIVVWNKLALKLAKKFWPGALTLVLGLGVKGLGFRYLSAGTGFLGLRMPNNKIALDLAKHLKRPITATSANVSGKPDCYSINNVINQFKNEKFTPDILIDFGKLSKRSPSTLVKINNHQVTILRQGPITRKQIENAT